MSEVRVRMAPSPTGEYHIGHIRTVLYNYAFAKKMGGQFIIRIEDTDRVRFVEGATERILQVIKDYGLDWDEGPQKEGEYGPYIQSQRLDIYKEYIQKLVEKNVAYPCFCTPERLTEMREEQRAKGIHATKYDKKCLHISKEESQKRIDAGESHVYRLNVEPNQEISFDDIVYGKITFNSSDIDDQVLLKSDGFPTYHFAVVVDDYLMKITHVLRGNDWLPSTPKHILLYKAFGWDMPIYAHLPNLKELGGTKKLSKRNGPVAAREFLDEGYLPEALDNFVMLLGWKPGSDQEFYTLDEFIDKFELESISKTDLVAFDRNKLRWMNGEYIKRLSNEDFAQKIKEYFDGKYNKDLEKIAPLVKERISTLKEFASIASFFFEDQEVDTEMIGNPDHVRLAYEALNKVNDWTLDTINDALMEVIADNEFKTGKFFMDIRIAVTGSKVTPPINDSIAILGKERTLLLLQRSL